MIKFKDNYFYLEGKSISYIMHVDNSGYLLHSYFGRRIAPFPPAEAPGRFYCMAPYGNDGVCLDEIPQECPSYGHADLRSPAVHFRDKTAVLKYKSHKIYGGKKDFPLPSSHGEDAETLEITLFDEAQGIEVILFYTIFPSKDTLARHTEIVSLSDELVIEQAYSMCLDFERGDFCETHFSGRWACEREKVSSPLVRGKLALDSARGGSGCVLNPFSVLHDKTATENYGDVYSFMLVYSGDHSTVFDTDQRGRTRVLQGINPFFFEKTLARGERFSTPEALLCFSHEGFGGMSRAMHSFIRDNILPPEWRERERPILINNWEATYMNFNEEKILSIVRLAKTLGIELFVLDDGWFGKRSDDTSSLGDWYVNYEKLPSGIDGLSEKVENEGLKFGLWFEPEMVSPKSELYKKHPDWVIRAKNVSPALTRSQLVLDLTKKEVQDFVISSVLSVLKSAKISYVKWDYNRYITDMPYKGYNYDYTMGLYRVMREIVKSSPGVLFEGCSSGGARFDAGILCFMPQIWTSDNTDPIDRVFIQYGTSFGYPPSVMGSHVTASPNEYTSRKTPLKTRGDVALSFNFGYELDITKLPEGELDEIKEQVKKCRALRRLTLTGDFYRLADPFEGNIGAWQIVSQDRSESFVCFTRVRFIPNSFFPLIKLMGLSEGALYEDVYHNSVYSADDIMYKGLFVDFPHGDSATYTLYLKKIE